MSLGAVISSYSAYNLWANAKLTHWLEGLGDALSYAETPSSYPSIDKTLQHMLRTQRFWLLFITEQDFSHLKWDVRSGEAPAIRRELIEVSETMKARFSAFSAEELDKVLHLDMPWAKNLQPRYEYILHCVNHSTFHRGQVITMARALGVTEGIPGTDYNFFKMEIR
jgi:uncharacterized damage-inducible protein DinB